MSLSNYLKYFFEGLEDSYVRNDWDTPRPLAKIVSEPESFFDSGEGTLTLNPFSGEANSTRFCYVLMDSGRLCVFYNRDTGLSRWDTVFACSDTERVNFTYVDLGTNITFPDSVVEVSDTEVAMVYHQTSYPYVSIKKISILNPDTNVSGQNITGFGADAYINNVESLKLKNGTYLFIVNVRFDGNYLSYYSFIGDSTLTTFTEPKIILKK